MYIYLQEYKILWKIKLAREHEQVWISRRSRVLLSRLVPKTEIDSTPEYKHKPTLYHAPGGGQAQAVLSSGPVSN